MGWGDEAHRLLIFFASLFMTMRFALRFHHSLLPMLAVTAGSLLLAASSAHAQDAFSDGFTTSGPDTNFTNVAGAWTSNGSTFSVTGDVQAFQFFCSHGAGRHELHGLLAFLRCVRRQRRRFLVAR